MIWRVEFDNAALKDLKRLGHAAQRRIVRYLHERIAIEENPRRLGKALHADKSGFWRFRVGDYRLICRIEDEVLTVLVIAIGHRSSVYKN